MNKKLILTVLFISIFIWANAGFCEFYKYDINTLAKKAQKRIKEIDEKLAKDKYKGEAQEVEKNIQEMLNEAESLFNEGKYQEAKKVYSDIIKITKDPKVKKIARKAKQEISKKEREKKKFGVSPEEE